MNAKALRVSFLFMINTSRSPYSKRALSLLASVAVIGIVMSVATLAKQRGDSELFDAATGYRISAYRASAPSSINGGKLIGIDALEVLIEKEKPLLVDVMYFDHGLLSRLSFGLLGPNPNRMNIPGSVWLPKLGQGKVDEIELAQIKTTLTQLTGGNMEKPMVYYCLSNCWVSWNAARRAIEMGYKQVYWFKDGTDVWSDAGLKLEPATPQNAIPARMSQSK